MKMVMPCMAEELHMRLWGIALLVAIVAPSPLGAGTVDNLISFMNNQVADADQVNRNFAVTKAAVDDNNARIAELAANVAALQAALVIANNTIADLQMQTSNIRALNDYVRVDPNPLNGLTGPHVLFEGANVHIRSGSGATDDSGAITGLGNLVVGYNEERAGGLVAGERDGAHNLIVGREHRYSSFGGLVVGFRNTINDVEASVSGGSNNTANGAQSSVSGGGNNTANGDFSSVSGGGRNTANGAQSSVSGGGTNMANGDFSSVSGGGDNMADGVQSSVSGGSSNTVSGLLSSVSGGSNNTASGQAASVIGDANNVFIDAIPLNAP